MDTPLIFSHLGRPAAASGWRIEAHVRAIAGTLILVGTALSLMNRAWLWLDVFVGANLLQSGLTGWCLMSNLLSLGRSIKPEPNA
jgi:hypothetical protein